MKSVIRASVIPLAQSLAWALVALLEGAILYLWVVVEGLVEPEIISGSAGLFLYGIANATGCFFIVLFWPKSIWYVPLIINSLSIAYTFWEPHFWNSSLWISVCGGWALCIVCSIAAALLGAKTTILHHYLESVKRS